jgi:hypothetical protein
MLDFALSLLWHVLIPAALCYHPLLPRRHDASQSHRHHSVSMASQALGEVVWTSGASEGCTGNEMADVTSGSPSLPPRHFAMPSMCAVLGRWLQSCSGPKLPCPSPSHPPR